MKGAATSAYNKVKALNSVTKKKVHGVDLSTTEALQKAATKPLYPIYVLPVENLEKLDSLVHHEEALARGLLREIKPNGENGSAGTFTVFKTGANGTTGEVSNEFQWKYTDNLVVFSHRWIRPSLDPLKSHPDSEDGIKLRAIKNVIEKQKEIWTEMQGFEAPLYIWMDYLCVPQRDREKQKKAILSIPAYFRQSCKFIALADDEESFKTYLTRGWCRLEVISSRIPMPYGGQWYIPAQQHVFFMNDGTSKELDWDHFANPIDGDLTDESDREYIGSLMLYFSEEMTRFKNLDKGDVYYQHGEREFLLPEHIPDEVVEKMRKYASNNSRKTQQPGN
eukprot:CAMPEP_0204870694 /NCGR_PEP_ID=MMETSP1348-20121228/33291_1 /ASSEMBLY_ACC=CAM_ASM_000700 /TAXON_ID=215587 /ORGANISM="Aplanochytrium stocchinoi, Strain GSBS06" /LENGTH=335 /DNA_ID=CAMNT_0052024637 /DNA_START=28 /DNA_END=1035 /DNA_ORIENTATION=-